MKITIHLQSFFIKMFSFHHLTPIVFCAFLEITIVVEPRFLIVPQIGVIVFYYICYYA
jgi:hypothetical protein